MFQCYLLYVSLVTFLMLHKDQREREREEAEFSAEVFTARTCTVRKVTHKLTFTHR